MSLWQRVLLIAPLIFAFGHVPQAGAAVALRVDARPVSEPIEVSVSVTDASGGPVTGLTASDFQLAVDGVAVASPTFSLPPAQDGTRKVSVVFAMDFSSTVRLAALEPMQDAVVAFINAMEPGDYAAIVKFNDTQKASVVIGFTEIDGAAGTSALIGEVMAGYDGTGSNVLDGAALAVQQLASPPVTLPEGPKAVILISDGRDNASTATVPEVVAAANAAGIPIFTIGVGDVPAGDNKLTQLAAGTSGTYLAAPSDAQIAEAYAAVSSLLSNEYLLTFQSSITDCNSHSLQVTVTGQTAATSSFTRCDAPPPPPPPPTVGGGGGGGGGGGAVGLLELGAGIALLALVRRRRRATTDAQPFDGCDDQRRELPAG
jgi:VWFA-related protein